MSVTGFIRKALAHGLDLDSALTMAEAFEAERPVNPVPAKPREYKLPMSAVVAGERYTLDQQGNHYLITDAVGPLYAYRDKTAAVLDFNAMFASRAGRAAA